MLLPARLTGLLLLLSAECTHADSLSVEGRMRCCKIDDAGWVVAAGRRQRKNVALVAAGARQLCSRGDGGRPNPARSKHAVFDVVIVEQHCVIRPLTRPARDPLA